MTELTRRRLLAITGAAGTAAVAGCSGAAEQDDEDDTEGKELGEISIENVDDEAHTVDVVVEFEGEIEHWSTHELEATSGVTLEPDWSTEPGEFRVTIRLDEDEFQEIIPDYFNDPPACLALDPTINREGALVVSGRPCGAPDADLETDDE